MEAIIRRLNPNDVALWKEIRLEALKNHPPAFGMSYEEEILYSDDKFREILAENQVFGAFDGERIVAIGVLDIYKQKKLAIGQDFGECMCVQKKEARE